MFAVRKSKRKERENRNSIIYTGPVAFGLAPLANSSSTTPG
jgi:hypothetical protein